MPARRPHNGRGNMKVCSLITDRKHVEDVKRDIDDHMYKLEHYIRTLNTEIKARTILIAVLEQTDAFYHNQRGEVKVVANVRRVTLHSFQC